METTHVGGRRPSALWAAWCTCVVGHCIHASGRSRCGRPRSWADLGSALAPLAEDGACSTRSDGAEVLRRFSLACNGWATQVTMCWTRVRRRGACLATARCFALVAPLRPGETRAGPAGRADPVAWFEARPSVAPASPPSSRSAAVRPDASAANAAAPMSSARPFSSSPSSSRRCPVARAVRAAAADKAAAHTEDELFQGVEAVEEFASPSAAAAPASAAMAAPRHGDAESRTTALRGMVALQKAGGSTESQDDPCRGPLTAEPPVARGLACTLRRSAVADERASGPLGSAREERRRRGRRSGGGPPS